ncbi:M48 family metalloprotease [Sphaerisporangium perillae]|uniref:M48 family metalloprotease n=1 Tax=Sphaerisporangium perillae TaxID=2935860 RepID=UPI002010BD8C|nr:M48 family metalloprotease [Sphaerisporangium perillae]
MRPDPFALPSATTTRFILLIGLTITTAMHLADGMVSWGEIQRACATWADDIAASTPAAQVTGAYLDCYTHAQFSRALFAVLVAGTFLAVVVLGHAVKPWLTVRRQKLLPLPAGTYPEASAEIDHLVAEGGGRRRPGILIDAYDGGVAGRAFGRFSSNRIRLSVGLVREYPQSGPRLRAILRHELAHIRNRDLDITSLALVSWWVFLAITIAAAVILLIEVPALILRQGIPLVPALLIVLVISVGIGRSREHYADVRAAQVNRAAGDPAFLVAAFGVGQEGWRRLLLWHPPTRLRQQVVEEPDLLLRVSLIDTLATGVSAGLAYPYLVGFTTYALGGEGRYGQLLGGFVVGLLVAAVVGTMMWRATLLALSLRGGVPNGIRPGLVLALGLLLGFGATFSTTEGSLAALVLRDWRLAAAAAALLAVICVAFCRWSAVTAAAWLPVVAVARRPLLLAVPLGGLFFGALLGSWSAALNVVALGSPGYQLFFQTVTSLFEIVVLLPFIVAVLFPLSARLRATRAPLPGSRRPRGAVLIPVSAVFLLSLVADLVLPAGLLPTVQSFGLSLFPDLQAESQGRVWVGVTLVAMVAAIAALVTTVMSDRPGSAGLGPIYGLLTAYLSGSVLVLVFLGRALIRACQTGTGICTPLPIANVLGVHFLTHVSMALFGGVIAVAIGAGIRTSLRLVRRYRHHWPDDLQAPGPLLRMGSFASALLVCVITAMLTVTGGIVWLAANNLGGFTPNSLPPRFPDVRLARPAQAIPFSEVCRQISVWRLAQGVGNAYHEGLLAVSRGVVSSDSRALSAFGFSLLEALQKGDYLGQRRSFSAIEVYCQARASPGVSVS